MLPRYLTEIEFDYLTTNWAYWDGHYYNHIIIINGQKIRFQDIARIWRDTPSYFLEDRTKSDQAGFIYMMNHKVQKWINYKNKKRKQQRQRHRKRLHT